MRRQQISSLLYVLAGFWGLYVLVPPLQSNLSLLYSEFASGLHSLYRGYANLINPVLSWVSVHRGGFAAVIILVLIVLFVWSIWVGLHQSKRREKDEIFGDPERTKGGWYWVVCGLTSLVLVWFYFSWGAARAFFPNSANEICQVATLNTAMRPIGGALPPRYFLGTSVVRATHEELIDVKDLSAQIELSDVHRDQIEILISEIETLLSELSDPTALDPQVAEEISAVATGLADAAADLAAGQHVAMLDADTLTANRAQAPWGVAEKATREIPFAPTTLRGALFLAVARDVEVVTKDFQAIKNLTTDRKARIDKLKDEIRSLKTEFWRDGRHHERHQNTDYSQT